MDEPRRRAPLQERPPQCLQAKPGGQGGGAEPTNDLPAVGIHDRGHIEPAFVGGNVGDVSAPNFVQRLGRTAVLEQIGGDGMIVIAVGGAGAATLAAAANDPLLAHDPGNSAATDLHSAGLKFDSDARAAVGVSAASVNRKDLLGKPLVLLDAATGTVVAPRVEAAAGNP